MDSIGIEVRMAGMDKGNMKSSGYPLGIDHGEELALGMDYVRRPLVYMVEKRVEERHRGIGTVANERENRGPEKGFGFPSQESHAHATSRHVQ